MKLKSIQILLFLIGAALYSCGPNLVTEKSDSNIPIDFFTNDLIDKQIDLLKKSDFKVDKTVYINGESESKKVGPLDSTAWTRELSLFKRMDITTPSVYSKYLTAVSPNFEATLKNGEKNTLKRIVITNKNGIKTIEATLSDDPILFKTGKKLQLVLEVLSDSTEIISEYHIQGFQKMITKDSVTYSIDAKILK